jgi:predicted patatin/cPLA2 family phospholipase
MWRRIILLFAISGAYALNGQCRVLAIGGGTERGAYEAGAISALLTNLPAGQAEYDVVTGVGIGSINAMIVANYPQGQESQAAAKLQSFWNSFSSATLYSDWVGGLVTGLLYESGLFDTAAMKKTIKNLAPGTKFSRWLGVGCTDLISGNYVFFNSTGQTLANMLTGIYASASDPGIFPLVKYSNLQLVSGSVKFSIDLLDAVNACYQLGYQENQIIIHSVLGAGLKIGQVEALNYKTLQVTMRYFEIAAYDLYLRVLENAKHDFPQVNIQYSIYPSKGLNHTLYPYDFTPAELAQEWALGQADALKLIQTTLVTE